ncbi:MAG TPA: VCBS repeat-containing protein, partial [Gemmataceae bacterium]|nr:VCBS repeat-containing protein [Gemmataceae bacterium]
MKIHLALAILIGSLTVKNAGQPADNGAAPVPQFRMQEIETGLKVGYAVLLVDINGDGKKDIVIADKTRVVWYENPTWKRRTIIEGKTTPDNVCIAAADIDGDGKIDLALGAGWQGMNSKDEAPLYWLKRGASLD